jgi:hypothetical protein
MTASTAIADTEHTPMPRPNSSQLEHWLDEEIDLLVRSIETKAEEAPAPPRNVQAQRTRFRRI